MTKPGKQAKTFKLEKPTWENLLSECIDSIGYDGFHQKVIGALKTLANIDYSVVFAYYNEEKPICLDHTFSANQHVIFVDDYLKGPYLLDPFFKACSRQIDTGLYRLRDIAPDRFYQSEYYRSYYIRTGLSEEICYVFYLSTDVAVAVSLMRSEESSRFSAREFRLLERVEPIVTSMAKRHWLEISSSSFVKSNSIENMVTHSLVEKTVSDLFGQRITPRETQVIAQVLEGYSSESIAKSLGISVGTVRIHRRNIYAKLQISSQQELFSIFFKEITKVHG